MCHSKSVYLTLANKISEQFKMIDAVEAIAPGGSQTSGCLDKHSDIDLYVYLSDQITLDTGQEIVEKLGASNRRATAALTGFPPSQYGLLNMFLADSSRLSDII